MAVSIQDIAKLRKMTGAGLTDCKHALEESNNDFDKAIEIIRKKGQAIAAKRSDRDASEGCVLAAHQNGFAAVVALLCETDFVAKNEGHIKLTQDILDQAMLKRPKSKEELLALPLADGRQIQEHITDRIGSTGEKMELGFYEYLESEFNSSYIHPGNMLGVVIAFNEPIDERIARNVAMQVASMNPVAVSEDKVPQSIVDEELKIAREKAIEQGKPDNIIDRIAQGALEKYFKENTLLKQSLIMDNKIDVATYLKQASSTLTVVDFKRVNLNEE